MIDKPKISKNQKTVLIILSMIPLVIIGAWGWYELDIDPQYSMRELVVKYPTIIDLKVAVDSGELDYNKLPTGVKIVLDEFNNYKGQSILENLK